MKRVCSKCNQEVVPISKKYLGEWRVICPKCQKMAPGGTEEGALERFGPPTGSAEAIILELDASAWDEADLMAEKGESYSRDEVKDQVIESMKTGAFIVLVKKSKAQLEDSDFEELANNLLDDYFDFDRTKIQFSEYRHAIDRAKYQGAVLGFTRFQ